MVKVKIRTGRGTGTIEVDVEDLKFSGLEFQELQKERKRLAGNRTVSTGRGTGTRKLQDTPEPESKPEPKVKSINRGTKVVKA
tara:strand:- start:73 stop:321 length:249 start_codon:yes stop_codon:yes gene_type:complete